jgi:hypothetical protein
MSLEEDLKARTLALISQQMANWVVEIQNHIRQHQANLVATLDELQESVARYDEKINEADVELAMVEVVSSQPPPPPPAPVAPAGPGLGQLRRSLGEIEKGTSLSEVLTTLVNEASQYVERAAIFIVKGVNAIGWYGRGLEQPDVVRSLNLPLGADTVFRIVQNSRHALRGHVSHSPGTAQALARMGGSPQGVLAVPLILRDKLAAILYCDTTKEELPEADATAIEILVMLAGKTIDLISLTPKPAVAAPAQAPAQPQAAAPAAAPPPPGRTTTAGISADRAAGLRAAVEEARSSPKPAGPPSIAPAPQAPAAAAAASSTVMFNAAQFQELRQQQQPAPAPPRPAPPPPAPPRPAAPPPSAAPSQSPEEHKAHEDAKRFARLVVSEIKLYNETKVNEGRRHRDLYERLKDDIERGRQMYTERVPPHIRDSTNYFVDELVRILAGGDAAALGPM